LYSFSASLCLFEDFDFPVTVRISLSISTEKPIGFWLGLHWGYKSTWWKNWLLPYRVPPSMDTAYFSIYLSFIYFLSPVNYSFCVCLTHPFPWLGLHVSHFDAIINNIFSDITYDCLLLLETQLIFVCWHDLQPLLIH
jgi:hypothetical protein